MSDANRTGVRVTRESSFKTMFANPLFKPVRITSVGLKFEPDTVTSNEIDPTRQITDQPLVGYKSGGDVPAELSIGNGDWLMEGLMMNLWVRSPEVINGASWKYGAGSAAISRILSLTATTLTLAATSVLAGSSVNSTAAVFVPGHLMYLSGFGGADQILRVSASGPTTVTVAGATAYAAPPATARVKAIGFEGVAGDVVATTTGGNALTCTGLNFTTLGLSVGQWVYIGGQGTSFGFANFAGFARISAIAATRLSFDAVPTGFAPDAGAGKTVRVFFTDMIKNGVVEDLSYTVEEEFGLSAGTRYLYHRGQEVNSRVLNAGTKAIITDTWNLVGADALPVTSIRTVGATTLTPSTGGVLNSSTAVPILLENGTPVTAPNYINNFTLSIENNKRMRDAVGILGAADIGSGRCNVTGTLSTYFGSEALYNKVIANTVSSFTVAFQDQSNLRSELWDIPKLKYSSGSPDVTGIDTDIFVPLAFQGLRDPLRDYTVCLSRWEYYA